MNPRSARVFGLLLGVVGSMACAAGGPYVAPGLPLTSSEATTCPFGDRGVRVVVEDVAGGVDVTLTGGSRGVDELRRRGHDTAAMYGPGAHRGLGHAGTHGDGEHHGLGLRELDPPVTATASDAPGGTTIHIVPVDPATLDAVRAEVHARAARARTGDCP